ncbi:RagB/SusD family nutrient uptake outer membrane protein [Sphingobacterium sp. SGG-5]|uniref:RagB/SusD family nutrient uptake outer membrane protein n=1 Tax=Sphingobacterium sp. SGG-5 TaxID=2710881 RepID=UPI0013EAEA6A|nr:RagB/SusD family nutrient uptake outer membrane protein [Sphingobacterium sp. SGG-5]NGM61553.1 RagB/SusD family nutrient uptake outer membrane protein [Sphingobacterium sp. SGG-5]
MKNIIHLFVISTLLMSCSKLVNVVDVDPPNNLVPENVAKTAEGARYLLNGTYAMLHDQYYYMFTEMVPAALTGTATRGGFLLSQQFVDNAVMSNLADVANIWGAFYKVVDHANWTIQLTTQLPTSELSETEKNSIIGEARALRAMAHFDALRYFGEFYDLESEFGVVIRTEPTDFTNRLKARSSVAETYQLILDDLDFAIANAPDFSTPIFFSNGSAKALKARVLLYRGEYEEAALLANEVIEQEPRSLSPTFSQVFSTGFNAPELLFVRATDAVTYASDRKRFTYTGNHVVAGPFLKTLMESDPRKPATYAANGGMVKVNNTAFYSPTYFIRLAEMYLIKAEGLARIEAPLDDAKEPLEAIMSRAWDTPTVSTATSHTALLDEIYTEIIKELCFENGSDWFASIRFGKISEVKPEVTTTDQYILPIPDGEIDANPLFGDQNDGY